MNTNETISQNNKKVSPLVAGILTVVAVLSVGFSVGLVTGVINVPFTEACCVSIPPILTPPPIPPIIPPTVLIPSCQLEVTAATADSATLSWAFVNTTAAKIDNGVGPVDVSNSTGSVTVSPTATTKYTLTVDGPGGEATCDTTVTVTPPPPPTCTLTAAPSSVTGTSTTPTLTYTTTNAASFSIDQGVPAIASSALASGTVAAPTITTSTTYTGTVTSASGVKATCTAPVTITPPGPNAPSCTLTATPTSYAATGAAPSVQPTLTWTTTNATSFTIDNSIGSVTPVPSGSTLAPAISATTTYSGVATGPGGTSAPCTATVVVTPPPASPTAPSCTLTAAPTSFVGSGAPKLTWTTSNATGFTLDNGIGAVPVNSIASGSTTAPTIASTTTYSGVATSLTGSSVPCTATVTITTGPVLACTLTAAPNVLPIGGGTTVLSYTSTNAVSFTIDNGIGAIASTSLISGTATSSTITGNTTFTGTVTDSTGATASCTAPVTVQTGGGGGGGGGGCSGGCGGGGGGHPNVTLSVLKQPGPQPLAFVYLSQIPYTGLDLGPVGTVAYWVALIAWSLAVAYLVLFVLFPYIARRMQRFGEEVHSALNSSEQLAPDPVVINERVSVYAPAPHVSKPPVTSFSSRGYSAYDGFRSFAKDGALSIDDIVGGLSRESVSAPVQSRTANVEPVYQNVEPIYNNVEPVYESVEPIRAAAPKPQAEAAPVAPEVPGFIEALLRGERETVFGAIRATVRAGGDAEAFLTQVVCALDDAYRARMEGTSVHPEVARVTSDCATPFLERLVTSLSTAVDSSYSTGITGTKLALTRALAIAGA